MNPFNDIDPKWAWQTWQPDDDSASEPNWAAHLYRRAGFGASADQLRSASDQSPGTIVAELISPERETAEFREVADALARTLLAGGDPMKLSAAWVYRMLFTPAQLLEKTTLFWHGHFATGADKVKNAPMMWDQNELLRRYALGDFAELTQRIAKDPAMLIYLDSASNRKAHPNENFARELMELFCLGEGHYSESDVLELARCFTGWEIRNNRFRKNRYQHDNGEKELLGDRGSFDGEQAVKIVVQQNQMPQFICAKLFRFFFCDEPDPGSRLLQTPAATLRENDYQIDSVVRLMLSSNLFFSPLVRSRKIRSPVELVIGTLRSLSITANCELIAEGLRSIGQGLFYPPNVKGWDGGRSWINSSTLLGRANLFQKIFTHEDTRFAGGTLAETLDAQDVDGPTQALDYLERVLMAMPIPRPSREQLCQEFESSDESTNQKYIRLLHAVTSLPEYQLG